MYKNTPRTQNKSAKACAIICLLVGALLLCFSGLEFIKFVWLIQAMSIMFFAAAIYIAFVYLLREYTFSVEQNSKFDRGGYDLIITERKGKKSITVCRIALDDIVGVRCVDKTNKKSVTLERKKMKRYTYDVQFLPLKQIEITSLWDDEKLSVMVTYDERLLEILESNINK